MFTTPANVYMDQEVKNGVISVSNSPRHDQANHFVIPRSIAAVEVLVISLKAITYNVFGPHKKTVPANKFKSNNEVIQM